MTPKDETVTRHLGGSTSDKDKTCAPAWTPGPWLCEDRTVYALCDLPGIYLRGKPVQGNRFSCRVQPDNRVAPIEELQANARLIAVVPELYAELQCARHTLVILQGVPEDSPCITRIDALLAKARGEA